MSAHGPRAAPKRTSREVRVGPLADSCTAAKKLPLFDHLGGACAQRRWNVRPTAFAMLGLDHQLELDRPPVRLERRLLTLNKDKATICDDCHIGHSALPLGFLSRTGAPDREG
jgi:hypothetical protein